MCKAQTDGGQRCAAHTRPAYQSAALGTPEWDAAAAQYASTPTGRTELTQARDTALVAGDYETVAAHATALRRGTSIRESNHATATLLTPSTAAPLLRRNAEQTHAQQAATDWLATEGAGWERVFDDPDEANGLCTDVAEDFTGWANRNGYDAENLDLNNGGPHTITVLNGTTVVDFTHRQFDPDCDVPLVSTLDTFLGDEWDITHRYRT